METTTNTVDLVNTQLGTLTRAIFKDTEGTLYWTGIKGLIPEDKVCLSPSGFSRLFVRLNNAEARQLRTLHTV